MLARVEADTDKRVDNGVNGVRTNPALREMARRRPPRRRRRAARATSPDVAQRRGGGSDLECDFDVCEERV